MDVLPADFQFAQAYLDSLHAVYTQRQVAHIVAALQQDGERCFWVNPLVSGSDSVDLEEYVRVDDLPHAFIAPQTSQLTYSDAASNGALYFQNASSYFAALALQAQPDQEVLDLAAAPGGKTIVLAIQMNNTGRLAAVEPVKGRFHRLRANLERCGVTNVQLYQRDGRGVGKAVPERFDRVLLDAPCSSESHMRWDTPGTYQHWSPRKVKECQRKQKSLIRSAYAALKPGGRMIYCTCSFSPDENELVVAHLLKRCDAQVVPLPNLDESVPQMPGLTQWRGKALPEVVAHTLRILPHSIWDGFYLACIEKPISPAR